MYKNIVYISLLIPVVLSCEKYFHKEDDLVAVIDNTQELEQAVSASYGLLARAFNSNYGMGFYNANIKGDDLNLPYGDLYSKYIDCDEDHYWQASPTDDYYIEYKKTQGNLWANLYNLNASLNNIITQFPNPLSTKKEYQGLIGEAYLLRAYSYFRLVRTYEKILLISDIEINYNQKAVSTLEVYEFIERDLNMAQMLLPPNRETSRVPGITSHRGVAKAILAEVYLTWAGYPLKASEKYAMAAQVSGEVIDSAEFFGFSLPDDFASLWDKRNHNNQASIFSIHFTEPSQALISEEINQVYWGTYNSFGGLQLDLKTNIAIKFFSSEVNFYNLYPRSYRKNITFYTRHFTIDKYDINTWEPIGGYYSTINEVNPCSRVAYRKFYYDADTAHLMPFGDWYTFTDFLGTSKVYLYRYAHTLLTYAEASARSKNLNSKSYDCINRIRRRANNVSLYSSSKYDLSPGLSIEIFADSVIWERAWEFAGEPEGRWFDLVRLERVEDLNYLRSPYEYGPPELPVTKEDYFFPVPAEEIYLNPNLIAVHLK